jgi:hypothetical protein
VLPVIAAEWLIVALVPPNSAGRPAEVFRISLLLGSLFGQATLAALWAALGPGPLTLRLAGSLAWIFGLPLAIAINVRLHGGPPGATMPVFIGLCLLAQWTVLQFPLWGLVLGYRMRLVHAEERRGIANLKEGQFGIGQLIWVTAIVGVFLGIGRATILVLEGQLNLRGSFPPSFVFVGVAAVVLTLPPALAALMKQEAAHAVGAAVVLSGLVTLIETPLLQTVEQSAEPGLGHLLGINACTAAAVLAAMGVVRWCGYRVGRSAGG